MVSAQLQGGVFEWPCVMVVIWPSSILLMALEAVSQPWWWKIAVPAVAVALNVALYSIVGAVVFALARRFARS